MNLLPLVILAVLISCAPPAPQATPPSQPPAQPGTSKPAVVEVKIIVGTDEPALKQSCDDKVNPTTVFVAKDRRVYHCVGNSLLDHANHGTETGLAKSVVRLSAGERVKWTSDTPFWVESVEKHEMPGAKAAKNDAPDFPFTQPFPKEYRTEWTSAPVRDEKKRGVTQRYKANFNIQGLGLVDPDLVCSF